MPQLISHRDGFSWQTPNVADILEPRGEPHDKTGQLRVHASLMVRKLAQLGAPARLAGVRPFASHTRYQLVPDKTGQRGSERPVSIEDLRNAIVQMLPDLNAQAQELVRLNPEDKTVTLFLRTSHHHPLNLQALMTQNTFLERTGYAHFIYGADLDQNAVVRDLTDIKNVLIAGSSAARMHLLMGIGLSLMLFNSPSYLRLALIGDETSMFRHLTNSPHILGSVVPTAAGFRRLLDGMLKHIAQRKRTFEKQLVDNLNDFNKQAISNKELKPLPRILLLLDTVALTDWRSQQGEWLVPLHQMLSRGPDYGLHVVISTPDEYSLPERISALFPEYLVMRSALARSGDRNLMPKNVPMQFVDALLIQKGAETKVTPIELAAVSEPEVTRAVTYWQNIKTRRDTEIENKSGKIPTGNTGLLTLREDMLPPAIASKEEPSDMPPIIPDRVVASSQALAAYLGWLGIGPLKDILDLTEQEAIETLRILRAIGVLETGDGPIWRFVRLMEAPGEA